MGMHILVASLTVMGHVGVDLSNDDCPVFVQSWEHANESHGFYERSQLRSKKRDAPFLEFRFGCSISRGSIRGASRK